MPAKVELSIAILLEDVNCNRSARDCEAAKATQPAHASALIASDNIIVGAGEQDYCPRVCITPSREFTNLRLARAASNDGLIRSAL